MEPLAFNRPAMRMRRGAFCIAVLARWGPTRRGPSLTGLTLAIPARRSVFQTQDRDAINVVRLLRRPIDSSFPPGS